MIILTPEQLEIGARALWNSLKTGDFNRLAPIEQRHVVAVYRRSMEVANGGFPIITESDPAKAMKPLPQHLRNTMLALRRYFAINSQSPTFDELRKLLELRSVATVHRRIHALEELGLVQLVHGRRRCLTLVEGAEPDHAD